MGECVDASADNLHFPGHDIYSVSPGVIAVREHDTFAQLHQRDQFAVGV